ncbi:MAG: C25 family cysteine peptidase [Thermoplasmatota archaeon]
MKKFVGVVCIMLLCLQAFTVFAMQRPKNSMTIEETFIVSTPLLSQTDENYVFVDVEQATSYLMEPGEPLLPKITKVYQIPMNAPLSEVQVQYISIHSVSIPSLVKPSPKTFVDGVDAITNVLPRSEIYEAAQSYPLEMYSYHQVAGFDGKNPIRYLAVTCYPVQYLPMENTLVYADSIKVTITYEPPIDTIQFPDEFDLMVIAPEEFSSLLQPFIDHKNLKGVPTILITLEDIYATYTGRDPQEQIKYAIKDAKETKGISYVLLVGGHKGQSHDWYLPVRYGHSISEESYLSDLYYADIYKIVENQTVFEDWDSNGNGDFAEFKMFAKDTLDGAPDVYVGRLAVQSSAELQTVLQKIITYEAQPSDDSWFKNMLLIGGDTYPESPGGVCEAEIDTNLSASYMTGFSITRLWASLGTLTGQADVEAAINEGAGFIHMAGHANPASLVTFPPNDTHKERKIIIMAMYNIYTFPNINPQLDNAEKLPVVLVGGCHNSQYNVSMANMLTDIKEYGIKGYFFSAPYLFYHMEWVPKCWSWWLTSNPNGGAIATLGNTGLGMGIQDEGYVTGLDGWLFPRFFYHYGQMGRHNIGLAQGFAITDYVLEFDINKDGDDRQMVQQWALLGDPSLLPGGYA